ncbi:DJ-1/PfpI family protein [Tenggerimyces flavus]|uniref:DJ-1/PfpI family protein n=1 Tax=Tenggerimyces flavus TaxID=1708749 RepID=A0ABV7YEY7_9ACTN|nr:DJ-1/PfpI family protein [Tenggerimyces flavus]MBM7787111.1 transcriptional regulator GlxA family with amidase domain [Tenggerimyces flavus]
MRAQVLMYDGIAEMDALLPFDILARAKAMGVDVEPTMVTVDGQQEIAGCYGTRFGGLTAWDPDNADALIVAGGWDVEVIEASELPAQVKAFKEQAGDRLILAGVDSGALIFGAAGLLEGRPATTFKHDYDYLAKWTDVVEARIVDDGDIVTSGSGWLAGLDLALYLLAERWDAREAAVWIEQRIGHDRRGTVWRRT